MTHPSRDALHRLVEELPPEEVATALRFLEHLGGQAREDLDRAVLRARLEPFAEEWDTPEMKAYDDCDSERSRR